MTEAVWQTCEDPKPMLDYIQARASPRKLRLFLVACARLVWDFIPVDEARQAVEVAERYADGLASEDDRDRASKSLWTLPVAGASAGQYAVAASSGAIHDRPRSRALDESLAYLCAQLTVHRLATSHLTSLATWAAAQAAIRAEQPAMLHEIFGNPFRPIAFPPSWRPDTALTHARQMYEARDFSAMPILADALQDAGCDSADILDHCRGPGPHVRGCWVVDLVLGKE